MTIRVVTDSTCDLPADLLRAHRITLVPIHIHFGSESFREGITIDRATFYRKVEETQLIPTTSQPSVGEFADTYRRLASEGAHDIISVHVTAKLSGTCSSAEMAKREVAGRVRVHVVDSGAGSGGLGYMVWEAGQMIEAGRPVADIVGRLEEIRSRMNIFLTLDNLKYAQMSGRVTRLQGALASLLNVKPIIALQGGTLDMTERVRSRTRAIERLLDLTEEAVGQAPVNLAVIHAGAPREAETLMAQAKQRLNCRHVFTHDLAISVAVHLGPGTLGLVSYKV